MADLSPFTPALELAAALRSREVSAVELLDACLAEVDRLNPELNEVTWRNDAGGARRRGRRPTAASPTATTRRSSASRSRSRTSRPSPAGR